MSHTGQQRQVTDETGCAGGGRVGPARRFLLASSLFTAVFVLPLPPAVAGQPASSVGAVDGAVAAMSPGTVGFPGGGEALVVLFVLFAVFVVGGALLAVLSRQSTVRQRERSWWRRLVVVVPNVQFSRDLLRSAAGEHAHDTARWERALQEFEQVERDLAAIADHAPDNAHERMVHRVRQALLDLRFAVETERDLHSETPSADADRLRTATEEIEQASVRLGTSLESVTREPE